MSPSRPFILRPVATTLLMVGVLLVGFVAYRQLPVSALPQVDYPTIQIQTFYPGASPDVMASSVTAPLERQFGQIPGLNQMTSSSSFGSSIITLQFNLDLNIDIAEQEVQASINGASNLLPQGLPNPPIYSKINPADAPILTLSLTSDSLPLSKVEDLTDTTLAQKISQLTGVGLVSISGGQRPAVRIQANPTALASYGLSLEDLRTALGAANVDQAKGTFDGAHQAYTIGANDQLIMPRGVINYYRQMAARYSNHDKPDFKRLQDFYRLFRNPGAGHCQVPDGFPALVNWVEHGVAPDQIINQANVSGVTRTRPLCPYPQTAIYSGSGSTDDAANFVCK